MLPIVSDRTQAGGSDKGVARNVVHLELAGVDVAQYEIRCAAVVGPLDTSTPTTISPRHAPIRHA
jgi:hypothetical protein